MSDPSTFCLRDHGCSLPAGHDGDCYLTAALCPCAECEAKPDDRPRLGPCVNPDCDADGECTCPGDRGFVGPVVPVAAVQAVETTERELRADLAHLLAVENYDSLGLGVMRCIAGGGSLADVLEFVGDHMNARDHVDDESIALFERAKAAARRPVALSPAREDGERFDFAAHLDRQRAWSGATFGPGDRAKGVVAHLRKELAEVEAAPGDLTEWIDVVILGLDGAWRSGASPQGIIAALVAKQARNERREWPDWRTADPDGPIEHVRTAHLRGCQAQQGLGLPCNCDSPGVVDGIAGDAPCGACGRDNRNGTHAALEMVGHLNHAYRPGASS